MLASMVVKVCPDADDATGALKELESVPVGTLLFKHSYNSFDDAVLL